MGTVTFKSEQNGDTNRILIGSYADDAVASPASPVVEVGFTPRHIVVVDTGNGNRYEWFTGMTNGHAVKTTGATGVVTQITTGGISISGVNRTATLPAASVDDEPCRFFITG